MINRNDPTDDNFLSNSDAQNKLKKPNPDPKHKPSAESLLKAIQFYADDFHTIIDAVEQYKISHPHLKFPTPNGKVDHMEQMNDQGKYIYPPLLIVPKTTDIHSNIKWGQKIKKLLLNQPHHDFNANQLSLFALASYTSSKILVMGIEGLCILYTQNNYELRQQVLRKLTLENIVPGTVIVVGSAIGSLMKKIDAITGLTKQIGSVKSEHINHLYTASQIEDESTEQQNVMEALLQLSPSNSSNDDTIADEDSVMNNDFSSETIPLENDLISDSENSKLEEELKQLQEHHVDLNNELNALERALQEKLFAEIENLREENNALSHRINSFKQYHDRWDELLNNKKYDELTNLNHDIQLSDNTKEAEQTCNHAIKRHQELLSEYQSAATEYNGILQYQGTLFKQKNSILEEKINAKKQRINAFSGTSRQNLMM